MSSLARTRRTALSMGLALAVALPLAACRHRPDDLREWRPEDHDRADEPSGANRAAAARRSGMGGAAGVGGATPATSATRATGTTPATGVRPSSASAASAPGASDGLATLVDVTWRTQCALCHGLTGKGDGPQGPLLHATDLTRPDFQSQVSDDQMARSITQGKNRMPQFDLPPDVVRGLVRRIRSLKGR